MEKNSIPLMKSNLQKAIRRQYIDIAVTTTLAMLQQDPLSFLRRLAIIYIEDVCLMDSYPIIIWLIMSNKYYVITTSYDMEIVLQIVIELCIENNIYKGEYKKIITSHDKLENQSNADVLFALYYRSEYGGMKGDITMVLDAINYYLQNPNISNTRFIHNVYEYLLPSVDILEEAIDFHPYPKIINIIQKQTNLDIAVIKQTIWNRE